VLETARSGLCDDAAASTIFAILFFHVVHLETSGAHLDIALMEIKKLSPAFGARPKRTSDFRGRTAHIKLPCWTIQCGACYSSAKIHCAARSVGDAETR
jgi:hypothetical protein